MAAGDDINEQLLAEYRDPDRRDIKKIKELLEAGADPNYTDNDGDPILLTDDVCLTENEYEIIKLMVKKGADVNLTAPGLNNTSMLMLYMMCDEQLNKMINDKDLSFNLNIQMDTGDTVLMLSIEEDKPNVVKTLIESGANVDIKNNDGKDALEIAMDKGNDEIVSYLEDIKEIKEEELFNKVYPVELINTNKQLDAFDPIMQEEIKSTIKDYIDSSTDNVIIEYKVDDSIEYFPTKKSYIRVYLDDVFYSCRKAERDHVLVPRIKNVLNKYELFQLRKIGLLIGGYVYDINKVFDTDKQLFRLVKLEDYPSFVSKEYFDVRVAKLYEDETVTAVSALHCQKGQDGTVYAIIDVESVEEDEAVARGSGGGGGGAAVGGKRKKRKTRKSKKPKKSKKSKKSKKQSQKRNVKKSNVSRKKKQKSNRRKTNKRR